ncbi:MAG: aspartate aminotransferase family protein [Thermoleophilia bacterium]|nr:aspartate aminotransferase family protein [Thermoleophilia bacterium]
MVRTSRARCGAPSTRSTVGVVDSARTVIEQAAALAAAYLESVGSRPVFPNVTAEQLRVALGRPMPDAPLAPAEVVRDLAAAADPGLVGSAGGRYFGFVIGGGLPAALAADWLTSAWDQNAGLYVAGPAASVVEEVVREWLVDLLGLPADASVGFVTGTQMAHVTGFAAARFHVLDAAGWDVGRNGLQGAPRVRVLVGEKRHVTVDRALRLLGLGAPTVVGADGQGRMRSDALAAQLAGHDGPTIVCAQAGEVNTGAFDPLEEIAEACRPAGAWLHVDGAFGLWAAAAPAYRQLAAGAERADSWTTDAHKWLNVPYDSGIVLCAHPRSHRAAMTVHAEYLVQTDGAQPVRDQLDWVPEFSRRARGFAVYAALRSLGRSGVAELVERCCRHARSFADRIATQPGVELLNEVVLNQVLFRYEDDARTDAVVERVQRSGRVWLSGTSWDGRRAIRVSVSNWQTGDEEIDLALETFRAAAAGDTRSGGSSTLDEALARNRHGAR